MTQPQPTRGTTTFLAALRRFHRTPCPADEGSKGAGLEPTSPRPPSISGRDGVGQPTRRAEMPQPSDPFDAWVEYRLCQLENWQTWITRLLIGSLAVQVGLKVLELLR